MTHRAGEPFTIKSLETIKEMIKMIEKSNLGSGNNNNNNNNPFHNFTLNFIDVGTIQKLENGEPSIPKNLYADPDAVGFFDSLHDFKSDFMDCQGNIRGITNSWNYKKFGFTFLLNGGYNSLLAYGKFLIQTAYSYLNRIPRPLNQDNLENYFSIGNIYDTIKNEKGDIYILPNTRKQGIKNEIYNNLITMFESYKDPNFDDKIKLVVDFQLNLFDIIQEGRRQEGKEDEFCLLYTAETITDPAPKARASTINEKFGINNWYIEKLEQPRTYDAESDNVRGNVNVTFNKIEIKPVETMVKNIKKRITGNEISAQNLEKDDFIVNVTYSNEDVNETIDVKMNSKSNTIQNIKNMIRNTIEKLIIETDRFNYYETSKNDRQGFYTKFNNDTLLLKDANDYKKKYTRYYARKRLGDTLQGRVCKKDKQATLTFQQVIINGNKYILDESELSIIVLNEKTDVKDAVLVTHDRMLFSYAVINIIPTILDLQEHMIVFIPNQSTSGGGTYLSKLMGTKDNQTSSIQNVIVDNVDDSVVDVDDSVVDDGDDIIIERNEYEYQTGEKDIITSLKTIDKDDKILIESIKKYVGEAIHYIYLTEPKSNALLEEVNNGLKNSELDYAYLGEYFNNALYISSSENFTDNVNNFKINIENTIINQQSNMQTRYRKLMFNNSMLIINSGGNILEITIKNAKETPTLSDDYGKYPSRWISYLDVKLNKKTYRIDDHDIYKFITGNEDNSKEFKNEINKDILSFYKDPQSDLEEPQSDLVLWVTYTASVIFSIFGLYLVEVAKTQVGGAGNDDETNTPLYIQLLAADFNFLNDKNKLFEKNITILYFLFNLLQSYEASFIGYQEGIDAFYTKIDESCILSDMIGVTNYIPHNIEFYVFLKLLLNDFDENNVNTINYALFEYYLYLLKDKNQIYSRFQDKKSYLLKNNFYELDVTDEITRLLENEENKGTFDYFDSIIKKAIEISQQIIEENYNAVNKVSDVEEPNFHIVYDNATNYNLTLRGFIDMKSEFITNTVNIVRDMVSKGLLTQYTSQINIDKKVDNDIIKNEEDDFIVPEGLNFERPDELQVENQENQIETPFENEKGKGIISYPEVVKSYPEVVKLERENSFGAGYNNTKFKKTRRNRRKCKNTKNKKNNKINKNRKRKTLKKSSRKKRSYKKK